MNKRLMAGLIAFCVAAPVLAEDPLTVPLKRLSLDAATAVAQGAIAACREKGIQIAVTVVDREGNVQVALRDTIAAPITLNISRMKAFTAVNFNAATSAMAARAESPIGRVEGLVMSAGGVPVLVGGAALVAGVGVSGAPDGADDEACALAGLARIQDDLDMAL
ncbi:adenosylcobalamin biosynthesis, GlcG-related protein [Thiocystis minor]|uniref:GlcG/HbpS family heme-binding protein n=1 Tax=Thiocystis minor TaxID=61597 RepID=UPI001913F736|nr:heme-binding protein [Thiocystis minor]MBK5964965.1 adenosylcobalamin biosynthesis, GlcG-related protein [Thiocystis minor]